MTPRYRFIFTTRFKRDFHALAKRNRKLGAEFDTFLQSFNPEAGAIIPGLRGTRKIRMAGGGKGKRSGYRIVYYWTFGPTVYFFTIYSKAIKEDLNPDERKVFLQLIDEIEIRDES